MLAKAFYAWIQVRNVAAAEKVDMDKTNKHYERRLLRRTFLAWHFMNVCPLYYIIITYNQSIFSVTTKWSKYTNCQVSITTAHQCRRGIIITLIKKNIHFTMFGHNKLFQRYLNWINEQLLACNCTQVNDIGDSLADGIPMIKALSVS